MKKTAQQIQDDIFRKMSVERKIRMASSLWNFAKIIAGDKIYYKSKLDYNHLRKWAIENERLLEEAIRLVLVNQPH